MTLTLPSITPPTKSGQPLLVGQLSGAALSLAIYTATQTADGALNYITNMVVRMKELATAAASETNGDRERVYLDNEVQSLKEELNRISRAARFNGRPLLTGEGGEIAVQVGPRNIPDVDRITVSANFEIDTSTLGIANLEISSVDGARESPKSPRMSGSVRARSHPAAQAPNGGRDELTSGNP